MKRTTILADEFLLLELRRIAHESRTTLTAVVQEALREYVASRPTSRRRISCAGVGASGRRDVSVRAEDLLERSVDRADGW